MPLFKVVLHKSSSALKAVECSFLVQSLSQFSVSVRIWAFADVSVFLFRFLVFIPRLFIRLFLGRFFLVFLWFSFWFGFRFLFLRVRKCNNKFSYNVSLVEELLKSIWWLDRGESSINLFMLPFTWPRQTRKALAPLVTAQKWIYFLYGLTFLKFLLFSLLLPHKM